MLCEPTALADPRSNKTLWAQRGRAGTCWGAEPLVRVDVKEEGNLQETGAIPSMASTRFACFVPASIHPVNTDSLLRGVLFQVTPSFT